MSETLGTAGIGHLIASTLSLCLTITTYVNERWQTQDIENDIIETVYTTKGLWTKCRVMNEMTYACEDYDKFWISLPADILAGRFGLGISMFFHVGSLAMQLMALSCNTFMKHNSQTKRMHATIACVFLFLSMLSFSIGVNWYGAKVGIAYTIDRESQLNYSSQVGSTTGGIRYVYGFGLFLAWLNMCIQIILTIVFAVMLSSLQPVGTAAAGLYKDDGTGANMLSGLNMNPAGGVVTTTGYRPGGYQPGNIAMGDMSYNQNNQGQMYNSNYNQDNGQMQYNPQGQQNYEQDNSYV